MSRKRPLAIALVVAASALVLAAPFGCTARKRRAISREYEAWFSG